MEDENAAPEPSKDSLNRASEQVARVGNSHKLPRDYRNAGVVGSETAAEEEPVGKFYFKRYRGINALLALFIIMVILAFFIYPRRQAVYRPQAFQVHLQVSTTVTGVQIAVAEQSFNRFRLNIIIWTDAPKPPLDKVHAVVRLQLPASVASGSCKASCSSKLVKYPGGFLGETDYIKDTTDAFAPITDIPGASGWINDSVSFIVTAPVFAWDENGLNIEAQLPAVQLLAFYPHQSLGDPRVDIIYNGLSDVAAYDWTGGPSPNSIARMPQVGGVAVWSKPIKELLNPIPISGADSIAASDDSFRTFVSGALLGIAGGALVGAIQEATHSKRRTRVPTTQLSKATAGPH